MKKFADMVLELPELSPKEMRSIKGGDFLGYVEVGSHPPYYWGNDPNNGYGSGNNGPGGDTGTGGSSGGGGSNTWNDNPNNTASDPIVVRTVRRERVWVSLGPGGYGGTNDNGFWTEADVEHLIKYYHEKCMSGGTSGEGVTKDVSLYRVEGDKNTAYQTFGTKVAVDNDGDPTCDRTTDPSYSSRTSYHYTDNGQEKYLDASKVAYVAIGQTDLDKMGAHVGDYVVLTNNATGKTVYAIIGDVGNAGESGEISYYAAQQLGLDAGRTYANGTITQTIFAGTGRGQFNISQDIINSDASQLMRDNPDLSYNQPPSNVSAKCK